MSAGVQRAEGAKLRDRDKEQTSTLKACQRETARQASRMTNSQRISIPGELMKFQKAGTEYQKKTRAGILAVLAS